MEGTPTVQLRAAAGFRLYSADGRFTPEGQMLVTFAPPPTVLVTDADGTEQWLCELYDLDPVWALIPYVATAVAGVHLPKFTTTRKNACNAFTAVALLAASRVSLFVAFLLHRRFSSFVTHASDADSEHDISFALGSTSMLLAQEG